MGPTGALPASWNSQPPRRPPDTPAHAPRTSTPVPNLDSASHIPGLPAKATSAFLWQPSSLQACDQGSGHTGLPSGQGEREHLGQITGLTPHGHMAAVGTVPSYPTCKGCCTAGAHGACARLPPPTCTHPVKHKSRPQHHPQEPSLNLHGTIPPASQCTPRTLWSRDPPGSH